MKVLKSMSIYTLAGFLQQGIAFPLAVIMTYYLDKAEMGILSLCLLYISILAMFIQVGSTGAVSVEFFKMPAADFRQYFSSAIVTPVGVFLFFSVVMLIFRHFFATLMSLPPYWVALLPWAAFGYFLIQMALMLLRMHSQVRQFAVFNISYSTLIFGLSLLLVIPFSMGWEGRAWAVTLTNAGFAVISVGFFRKWKLPTAQIQKAYIKDALRYGLPIIPHALGTWVIGYSDRIFIEKMKGLELLGVYNVGYTIGTLVLVAVMAFTAAYNPFLFEILSKPTERGRRKVALVGYGFLSFLFFFVFILSSINPFIFKYLISQKFAEGQGYVFWVAVSYFFFGAYSLFSGQIHYAKKTSVLAWLALINVATNLTLNYFLIQKFGGIGAVYATVISYLLIFLITASVALRLYDIPYLQVGRNLKVLKEILKEQNLPFLSKWL